MKILFSGPRYHANYNGMIQGLEDAGHEVHFLSLFDDFKYAKSDKTGLHHNKSFIKVPMINFGFYKRRFPPNWQYIPNPFALKKIIREINPDLIIARDLGYQTVCLKFISMIFKTKFLLYSLWHFETDYKEFSIFNRFLLATVFRSQNKITPVFTSNYPNKTPMRNKKMHAFYFPVINVEKRPTKNVEKVKFLCVSKLDHQRKNLKTLIDSILPLILDNRATLHIIGSVKDKNSPIYKDLHKVAESTEGISIEENLPYQTCISRYKEFDFFVLSALVEPLGYSILEAWSAGLPVLIADDGGLSGQVLVGKTGFVFKRNDKEDLVEKLYYIANHPEMIPEMSKKSLEIVEQNYQPHIFEKRLMQIYEKLG